MALGLPHDYIILWFVLEFATFPMASTGRSTAHGPCSDPIWAQAAQLSRQTWPSKPKTWSKKFGWLERTQTKHQELTQILSLNRFDMIWWDLEVSHGLQFCVPPLSQILLFHSISLTEGQIHFQLDGICLWDALTSQSHAAKKGKRNPGVGAGLLNKSQSLSKSCTLIILIKRLPLIPLIISSTGCLPGNPAEKSMAPVWIVDVLNHLISWFLLLKPMQWIFQARSHPWPTKQLLAHSKRCKWSIVPLYLDEDMRYPWLVRLTRPTWTSITWVTWIFTCATAQYSLSSLLLLLLLTALRLPPKNK